MVRPERSLRRRLATNPPGAPQLASTKTTLCKIRRSIEKSGKVVVAAQLPPSCRQADYYVSCFLASQPPSRREAGGDRLSPSHLCARGVRVRPQGPRPDAGCDGTPRAAASGATAGDSFAAEPVSVFTDMSNELSRS